MVAHPITLLDEAEADQKGTKTGVGGYPHGGVLLCKIFPVFQDGKVLPPLLPQLLPLATAAGPCSRPNQRRN